MPTHRYNADPYYKIIVPNTPGRKNQTMIIVCIQDFDEYDYYSEEWLRDDDGEVSFDTRADAREYLAEKVHSRWIDAEDRMTPTSTHVDRYRLP